MTDLFLELLRLFGIALCFAAPAYIIFKYPDDPEW